MPNYLKDVQNIQLSILKKLIDLFEKRDIRYFAIGGTALGAYRHQGFIPWDDDVDIAIPREDYDRFLRLRNELPEDLFLQHYTTDSEYLLYYAKVRKKGTVFLEERDQYQNMHHGVSLDVFPFDNVIIDNNRKKNFVALERRFARANRNRRGVLGRLKSVVYQWLYSDVSACYEDVDRFVQALNNQNTGVFGPPHADWYLKEDEVFPLREIDFEDIKVSVPNRLELYLERAYGDYMTLPNEKDRVAHKPMKVIV